MCNCSRLYRLYCVDHYNSFHDLLWRMMMIEKYEEEKVGLVVSIAWCLWANRNEVQHGGKKKGELELV